MFNYLSNSSNYSSLADFISNNFIWVALAVVGVLALLGLILYVLCSRTSDDD